MKMLFGDLSLSSASPLKIAAWEAGGEAAGIKKSPNYNELGNWP